MGWFDEQIRQRIRHDNDVFSNAFADMSGVVMGEKITKALNDDRLKTKNAIEEILKFYHVKPQELPDTVKEVNDELEYLLRPSGFMRRTVHLEGAWYQDAVGAMLASRKDGGAVALIPGKMTGYTFLDSKTGKRMKVNRKTAPCFDTGQSAFIIRCP